MSDTARATAPAGSIFLPRNWLLSPAADRVWLLGSVLVSFSLYALWRARVLETEHLVLIWVFIFHGPHFWSTISRTYLDPTEWPGRRRLFLGSLAFFAIGPLIVGASVWIESRGGSPILRQAFFYLAALWAYHHVVKQHFGFMALYRARAREFDRREFLAHKWYLILSLWMPAIIVLASPMTPWLQQLPYVASYAAAAPENAQRVLTASNLIVDGAYWAFWGLQIAFALHLIARVARGRGINLQETMVAVAAVSLHWVAVRSALIPMADDPLSYYAFVPLVTIFHNIQYHALIWHYNRAKYQSAGAAARYRWAHRLNRSFWVYAACGVAFTLVTIGVEHYGLPAFDRAHGLGEVLAAFIWGYAFLHYYVDSKIWHVRQDAELRRVLGFS